MASSDVKTVDPQSGKVAPKRRFDLRDFDYVADYMIAEYEKRKKDRKDRERCWAEIDRQIAMEPSLAFKRLPNGTIDPRKFRHRYVRRVGDLKARLYCLECHSRSFRIRPLFLMRRD